MASGNGHRVAATLCAVALSLATSAASAAVNLLANPGFGSDLTGWTNLYARPASWSALDADDSATSGSAFVGNDNSPSNGGIPLVLWQCVAAVPFTPYTYGGRLRVPAGQPPGTSAYIVVQTFPNGSCFGHAAQLEAVGGTTTETWEAASASITTGPTIRSIFFAIGIYKPNGETLNASGHYDNLFLEQGEIPTGLSIGPWMSATWYNPAESGHGIMIHVLDAGSAWMCWFTFDLAGNRAWICSLGTIAGDTLAFGEAFVVEGGNFPPLFDPSKIVEVPWGQVSVKFASCNNATMTWTTSTAGFQSGSMPVARLTPLWGNPCP